VSVVVRWEGQRGGGRHGAAGNQHSVGGTTLIQPPGLPSALSMKSTTAVIADARVLASPVLRCVRLVQPSTSRIQARCPGRRCNACRDIPSKRLAHIGVRNAPTLRALCLQAWHEAPCCRGGSGGAGVDRRGRERGKSKQGKWFGDQKGSAKCLGVMKSMCLRLRARGSGSRTHRSARSGPARRRLPM
jgi:hypothetical protein